jgi:hypothetical protein
MSVYGSHDLAIEAMKAGAGLSRIDTPGSRPLSNAG